MLGTESALGTTLLEREGIRIKATRHGLMLYQPHDIYIGRCLDLYGEYSELEVALLNQIVTPGMVVIDVGANIGAHTIFFAAATGPKGLVIAYEPQRIIHQILCANLALNQLSWVKALQAGAGARRGHAHVPLLDYGKANNFGGISLNSGVAGESIEVIPIDAFDLLACHLLKVDVEGMESEVLAGAAATIARHRPVLYVENDRRAKSPALITQLRSLGYDLYWHLPRLYNPDNYFGNATDVFGTIVSCNLLCVPSERQNDIKGLRPVAGPEEFPD